VTGAAGAVLSFNEANRAISYATPARPLAWRSAWAAALPKWPHARRAPFNVRREVAQGSCPRAQLCARQKHFFELPQGGRAIYTGSVIWNI
jgi:hypothetical protein